MHLNFALKWCDSLISCFICQKSTIKKLACELQNLFILSRPFSRISSTFFPFFAFHANFACCQSQLQRLFCLSCLQFFFCHFVVLLILLFAWFANLQILVETHVQGFRILRLAPYQSVHFQPCTNEYLSDQKFMCCFKVT